MAPIAPGIFFDAIEIVRDCSKEISLDVIQNQALRMFHDLQWQTLKEFIRNKPEKTFLKAQIHQNQEKEIYSTKN